MENHPVRNDIRLLKLTVHIHELTNLKILNTTIVKVRDRLGMCFGIALSLSLSLSLHIYIYIYSWWLWWKPHNYDTGGTNSYLYIHQESLISSQVSWYWIDRLVVMLAIKLTNKATINKSRVHITSSFELILSFVLILKINF